MLRLFTLSRAYSYRILSCHGDISPHDDLDDPQQASFHRCQMLTQLDHAIDRYDYQIPSLKDAIDTKSHVGELILLYAYLLQSSRLC